MAELNWCRASVLSMCKPSAPLATRVTSLALPELSTPFNLCSPFVTSSFSTSTRTSAAGVTSSVCVETVQRSTFLSHSVCVSCELRLTGAPDAIVCTPASVARARVVCEPALRVSDLTSSPPTLSFFTRDVTSDADPESRPDAVFDVLPVAGD